MPLFRVTFFLKNAGLLVSVFEYVRNYGHYVGKMWQKLPRRENATQ